MDEEKKNLTTNLYGFMIEIGFSISIPLVVFVLVGIWLDKKYNTGYLFLLAGIGLSLISSTMAIYRAIKNITEQGK